jgi:hypothetical protein
MFVDYQTPYDDRVIVMGTAVPADRSMTLTKQFKGLELSQPVRLLEATPEYAVLQATNPTLIPLLEGVVSLHSQAFSTSIVGRVEHMNYVDGVFHLADFSIQDWKQRQYERVQPKDPTYITMRWRQKAGRVCLEDISVSGMGVFAGREVGREIKIEAGLIVHLDFRLYEYAFEHLEGRILYRQRVGQCVEKLGIRLFPNSKQRRSLEEYVALRRQEILAEVSEIYIKAREPHGVECQYF